MLIWLPLLIIGTIEARRPEKVTNTKARSSPTSHRFTYNSKKTANRYPSDFHHIDIDDYDDNSRWLVQPRAPLLSRDSTTLPKTTTNGPIKVHLPREDPRLFYQSDTYLKEINRQNVNNTVAYIYPGKEVIRPFENVAKLLPIRMQDRFSKSNSINDVEYGTLKVNGIEYPDNICVRCPNDRTLIAKPGIDKVYVHHPVLYSCSGHKAPRNTYFIHMHEPEFGSLMTQGSHTIVGRISYKGKTLQICKVRVNIVTKWCPTPSNLVSHCKEFSKPCNITCRDPKLKLYGQSSLMCGNDMKWKGNLPVCRATWCGPPPTPDHGRVSCKGATAGPGLGLEEGSRCRVRCYRGYRWRQAVTFCRHGRWTNPLTCVLRRNNI